MNNEVKDIDIKNRTYYFLDDIINIENFIRNNIKIHKNAISHTKKKSYKYILIYYIGYVTIK